MSYVIGAKVGAALISNGVTKSAGQLLLRARSNLRSSRDFARTAQQQQQQQQQQVQQRGYHHRVSAQRRIGDGGCAMTPRALLADAAATMTAAGSSSSTNPPHTIPKRWHGGPHVDRDHADSVHINFIDNEGNKVKADVDAYIGESLLQVAQRNDIELEGACEGVCACSTCHVIIPDEEFFDNVLEEASEDEEDMLDMAYGLTETSRLGCQIIVTDEMDGIDIEIPPATRNFYVDGHVPQPH